MKPSLIKNFVEQRSQVTQISCGLQFTTALTSNGNLYAWGYSEGLRCGVAVSSDNIVSQNLLLPTQIKYDTVRIIVI